MFKKNQSALVPFFFLFVTVLGFLKNRKQNRKRISGSYNYNIRIVQNNGALFLHSWDVYASAWYNPEDGPELNFLFTRGAKSLTTNEMFGAVKAAYGLTASASTSIDMFAMETLVMPLPKLKVASKLMTRTEGFLIRETGGLKQWLRLGSSYSKTSGTSTFGLRWGAGGGFSRKIGSGILRDANDFLKSGRGILGLKSGWNEPGHLHFFRTSGVPKQTFGTMTLRNVINLSGW